MAMYNNSGVDMLPKSTFLPNGSLGGEGESGSNLLSRVREGEGKLNFNLIFFWVRGGGQGRGVGN